MLLPDHLHALLSFARDQSMSQVIGDWKRFHARIGAVKWQEGYSIIDYVMTNAANSCRPK